MFYNVFSVFSTNEWFPWMMTIECPADLIVKNPDGDIINKQLNEIQYASYFEDDFNYDSDPDDMVLLLDKKTGVYEITVVPEPDAEPTDTFTLKVLAGDKSLTLAENMLISNIPDYPYLIDINEDEITPIIPAYIEIQPDTLCLNSQGRWINCYIDLPEDFDVENIDIETVVLNDVIYAEDHPVSIGDFDEDGIPDLMVKFDREDVIEVLELDDDVEITVGFKLFDGTVFRGVDYIRIIGHLNNHNWLSIDFFDLLLYFVKRVFCSIASK
jgi:hypothetical protein